MVRHVRANAIAYLALFVALGGTAYAVNQIGARDIKRDAIRVKHIKEPSVGKRLGLGVYFGEVFDFSGPADASLTAPLPFMGRNDLDDPDSEDVGAYRLLAPVKLRFRDLRARVNAAANRQVIVELGRVNETTVTPLLRCVLPAGETNCTARGPSPPLRPGELGTLRLVLPVSAQVMPDRDYMYSVRIVPG